LVVEEYVDGELLADHLVLREITEAECIDIAVQICSALEVLHNHKPAIIHRDVKPSNIIVVPNGKVKLIDYDSSRLYKEESESDTRFLGTENYAAPEQFGYSQTDCRSDIYSLGVVLRRFKEFLKPAVIKKWEKIVEKCTLFSPDSRYQHVSEVKDKLRKIRKSIGAKYKIGIAVFVILLILVVPVIVYLTTRKDRQPTVLLQGTKSTIERLTTEISTKETTTTVEILTTELETTEELTTEAPTTEPSTTEIPTTEAPTTEVSTTETPTTEVPTTENVTMDSVTDMPIVRLKEEILSGNEAYPDKIYAIQEWNNPKIAALKKYICDNNALVLYHIKQRMSQRNFYYQVKELQAEECTLSGLKLISENDGSVYIIEDKDYEVVNFLRASVIQLAGAFLFGRCCFCTR
jgi:serine/threonine protein kinase